MLLRGFASSTKVHKIAKERQRQFFWSGKIEYFQEMYMNIVIGIGFNLAVMSMDSTELGFNTLFCVYMGINALVIPLLTCIYLY